MCYPSVNPKNLTTHNFKRVSPFWAVPFVLMLFLSCARKPSVSELNELETAIASADAAERKVQSLEAEKQQLEEELEREKQTLRDYETEYEEIKVKLAH